MTCRFSLLLIIVLLLGAVVCNTASAENLDVISSNKSSVTKVANLIDSQNSLGALVEALVAAANESTAQATTFVALTGDILERFGARAVAQAQRATNLTAAFLSAAERDGNAAARAAARVAYQASLRALTFARTFNTSAARSVTAARATLLSTQAAAVAARNAASAVASGNSSAIQDAALADYQAAIVAANQARLSDVTTGAVANAASGAFAAYDIASFALLTAAQSQNSPTLRALATTAAVATTQAASQFQYVNTVSIGAAGVGSRVSGIANSVAATAYALLLII